MSKAFQDQIMSRIGWRRILMCLAIVVMSSVPAIGQLTTGSVMGTVTDQSGAAIPGAAVTVKNTETGVTRSTLTKTREPFVRRFSTVCRAPLLP
jgi:hypothetical protein